MPSLFAGLAAAASATVDAVFGEGFHIVARAKPAAAGGRPDVNAASVATSARVSFPFQGVFADAGAILHAHGRTKADATTKPVVAEQPMVDVDVASLQERPQVDDHVVRDDTGERFCVTRFKLVDFGRAQIHLAEIR